MGIGLLNEGAGLSHASELKGQAVLAKQTVLAVACYGEAHSEHEEGHKHWVVDRR